METSQLTRIEIVSPPQNDWLNGVVSDYLVGIRCEAHRENSHFVVKISTLAEKIEMRILADWIIEASLSSDKKFLTLSAACCKELSQ